MARCFSDEDRNIPRCEEIDSTHHQNMQFFMAIIQAAVTVVTACMLGA